MEKPRILICDDEEGIRESLNLILAEDYNVAFTASADEAAAYVKSHPNVQVVLLDIKMPGKSGLEIISALKNINPNVKVLIVTGYRSVEIATTAVKSGASGYIVKPFNKQKIQDKVKQLLSV